MRSNQSSINPSINQINQSTEGQYSSLRVSSRERGREGERSMFTEYGTRDVLLWRVFLGYVIHRVLPVARACACQGSMCAGPPKIRFTSLTHARGQNEIVGHHYQYWLIWTVCPVILYGYRCMLQSVEKKLWQTSIRPAIQTNRHNGDFSCRDVIVTVAIWVWIS